MKSTCCYSEIIKGGVLNGEQVLICTKCKKAVVDRSKERIEKDLIAMKNSYRDVVKKNINLKQELEELKEYVIKLEKFAKK
jgi:transposase-like protein